MRRPQTESARLIRMYEASRGRNLRGNDTDLKTGRYESALVPQGKGRMATRASDTRKERGALTRPSGNNDFGSQP